MEPVENPEYTSQEPIEKNQSELTKSESIEIINPGDLFEVINLKPAVLDPVLIYPLYVIDEISPPIPVDPILRLLELKKRYYTYNTIEESEYKDNEISAVYADNHYYYLGSVRGGVFRYSQVEDNFLEIKVPIESISNLSITGIVKWGEYLVFSSYSGMYLYDMSAQKITRVYNDIQFRGISSIYSDNNDLYIGNTEGILYKWSNGKLEHLVQIKHNIINSLLLNINRIYIGTSNSGLLDFNFETKEIKPVNFANERISEGKISFISIFDEKIWVGAGGDGLFVFDLNFKELLAWEQNKWFLSTCHSENIIYFGTNRDGLLFYDKIKKERSHWGIGDGLPSLYIPALFYNNRNIYISTPEEGVVIINEQINE